MIGYYFFCLDFVFFYRYSIPNPKYKIDLFDITQMIAFRTLIRFTTQKHIGKKYTNLYVGRESFDLNPSTNILKG